MIPAPLRAPPTGITDAGYKVWLGVFVLANHESATADKLTRIGTNVLHLLARKNWKFRTSELVLLVEILSA
jgi:hypothetical protein